MFGPWAASAAARSLRLGDQYLASVYRHTELHQAFCRCDGEDDLPDPTPQQQRRQCWQSVYTQTARAPRCVAQLAALWAVFLLFVATSRTLEVTSVKMNVSNVKR